MGVIFVASSFSANITQSRSLKNTIMKIKISGGCVAFIVREISGFLEGRTKYVGLCGIQRINVIGSVTSVFGRSVGLS